MSLGKKKSSAPKVSKVTSPFSGVQRYNVDLPGIASGSSYIDKSTKSQVTSGSLSEPFKQNLDLSNQIYKNNASYLSQDPTQRYQDLQAGNNAYYNAQRAVFDRNLAQQQAALQSRYSRSGLENSTARGAVDATLLSDAALRGAQLENESLNFQNNQALQNANAGLQGVNQYSNIAMMPAQLANQNFINGTSTNTQVAMANAQAQNQANMAQWQAQNSGSNLGSTIGTVVGTLGGLALAPFTGGSSLMLAGLGGTLGGAGGSLLNRSGASPSLVNAGYSPFGSYMGTSYPSNAYPPGQSFYGSGPIPLSNSSPYLGKVFG